MDSAQSAHRCFDMVVCNSYPTPPLSDVLLQRVGGWTIRSSSARAGDRLLGSWPHSQTPLECNTESGAQPDDRSRPDFASVSSGRISASVARPPDATDQDGPC